MNINNSCNVNILNYAPVYQEKILPTLFEEPITEKKEIISSKDLFHEIKQFYTETSKIPGALLWFLLPYEFVNSCYAYAHASATQNKEALTDLRLKIISIPSQYAYSFFALSNIVIQAGIILNLFKNATILLTKSLLVSSGAGIVACVITGGIESRNIWRLAAFHFECKNSLALIKSDKTKALEALQFLEAFTKESSESKTSLLTKLSNRVTPWCAEKIDQELPRILEKIRSPEDPLLWEDGIQDAIALLEEVDIQVQKKMLNHSLTLLVITIFLVAFVTLLAFQPYLIPIVLFSVGYAVYLANSIHASGTLDHSGWEFKAIECVPDWIRRRF